MDLPHKKAIVYHEYDQNELYIFIFCMCVLRVSQVSQVSQHM